MGHREVGKWRAVVRMRWPKWFEPFPFTNFGGEQWTVREQDRVRGETYRRTVRFTGFPTLTGEELGGLERI